MKTTLGHGQLPSRVQRFNLHQRLQHSLLAISVMMLILTGFPIKYGQMDWAAAVIRMFGGFETLFKAHLYFAITMLVSGLYHLAWLMHRYLWQELEFSMVPRWKDVKDAIHHYQYMVGLKKTPPLFDRYSYLEKFEYLAVIWGTIVMGLSGIILWYPRLFTWMPRWGMDVARVVHSNEAFVAMLALFMGHFFAVHFNPRVFPTSKVWLDGSISTEQLAEEHPLEYRRFLQTHGLQATEEISQVHETKPSGSTALIIVELLGYSAIFTVVLVTVVRLIFK